MIKAFGKRVIVRLIDLNLKALHKTHSLMLVTTDSPIQTGQVVCYGCEVDCEISLHDIVYFLKHHGMKLEINGEEYWVLEESQILAGWCDK